MTSPDTRLASALSAPRENAGGLAGKRHFHTLDGLRGVAALSVVAFHGQDFFGRFRPASAYLAVDFFLS